jgi:hypothetical protein
MISRSEKRKTFGPGTCPETSMMRVEAGVSIRSVTSVSHKSKNRP